MAGKRDKSYYLKRLQSEHPALHSEVTTGKTKPWDAIYRAGLKKRPKAINTLKNHWGKATTAEREEFLDWLADKHGISTTSSGTTSNAPARGSASSSSTPPGGVAELTDADNYLTVQARDAINDVLRSRNMTVGQLMREIGEAPLDSSVGIALRKNSRIKKQSVREGLKKWLSRHGYLFR